MSSTRRLWNQGLNQELCGWEFWKHELQIVCTRVLCLRSSNEDGNLLCSSLKIDDVHIWVEFVVSPMVIQDANIADDLGGWLQSSIMSYLPSHTAMVAGILKEEKSGMWLKKEKRRKIFCNPSWYLFEGRRKVQCGCCEHFLQYNIRKVQQMVWDVTCFIILTPFCPVWI